ncbi:MAG: zeta toxin family protein [Lewinellaceae bacterium]|nr:zeta toxin family protein [Lewinellaceae bacterium]
MKSKSLEYIERLGKKQGELPEKYRENLEVMQEFAEIYSLVDPGSEEAKEAKAEYEDYDEKILEALKRDYPLKDDKKKEEKKPKAKFSKGDKVTTDKGRNGTIAANLGYINDKGDITYSVLIDGTDGPVSIPEKSLRKREELSMPPVDENGQRRIDKPALDALEAHLETLPQTKEMHTTKGKYTEGRQALHTKVIKEELADNACIKRDAPIAILTGGLPGSGKSTFIRKNRDWMTNPAIFKIDADEVRAKLPEYKGWNAPQTHQESRDIVNQLIEKIGANGCSFDIIYDGTMNKSEKYGPLIKKLKEEGYQVFVLYMKVDKKTSMNRAMGRYQKSGRYVPRFIIEEAAKNGLAAFNEIKEMVDGYVLVDGVTQKVLEKGGKEIPQDRDYSSLSEEKPDTANTPAPNRVTDYNWKDNTDIKQLSPIVIHCQHYHLEAKEEMEVGLKGKGNATRKVPVKPGEHLIFDDGGYLVFVMDAESFERKCIEQTTVEVHEKKKHRSASEDKPKVAAKKEDKPKAAPQAKEKPKPAPKAEEKPEERPKAEPKPKAKAKKASAPRKKAKPAAKKEPASSTKPKTGSKPQAKSNSTVDSIEKEINDIRKAQGKKPLDRDLFRKEYQDLAEKKDNKSYLAYIRKQLKQAQDEGVEFGEQEIINLGIAIRPLIQRKGAALLDILLTSKKVLAPTYDNLIRWTESPGRYDLQGVDVSAKAEESVKARKVKQPSLFDMIGL